MAAITVRNLDEGVRDELRIRAARHGRSMEAEVRAILTAAVGHEQQGANALMDLYWSSRDEDDTDETELVSPRNDVTSHRVDFSGDEFG